MMVRIGNFDFSFIVNLKGQCSIFIRRNCGNHEGEGMEISFSRFNRIFEDLFEKEM